jgi:hypothetical protein
LRLSSLSSPTPTPPAPHGTPHSRKNFPAFTVAFRRDGCHLRV